MGVGWGGGGEGLRLSTKDGIAFGGMGKQGCLLAHSSARKVPSACPPRFARCAAWAIARRVECGVVFSLALGDKHSYVEMFVVGSTQSINRSGCDEIYILRR